MKLAIFNGLDFTHRPRMICRDGFSMSVQYNDMTYSERDTNGEWSTVEVGFPSEKVEALMPYAEDPDKPTKTVYGYVPIKVIVEIILSHGGLELDIPLNVWQAVGG